ncbi:DAK2 domain-containing protein [Anaerosalibacter sp. Marseille-P3206]|uniref:DAK2 domain-containing protein n=1 Tax=Anaerosalibacter sp. Marseille-P3206 TaxID=1871005 RepID=UPI000986FCC3|nr:DAK2 domain-containing protein [Anaerosalibacter sp. Marseille-P3206]
MRIEYIDGATLKRAFIGAANYLEANKEEVNALNVFPVPDGDTGTNMSLTVQSAIKEILNLDECSAEKVALAASNGSLMGARGNSGVILSQLYRGFANGLKDRKSVDTTALAEAFNLASETAYKAVMKPTEGTILTVARGCAEKAIEISKKEKDVVIFMNKVIEHGNYVLSKTPEMLPVLKEAGVVDAGGKGLMVILEGSFKALISHGEIKYEPISAKKDEVHFDHDVSTGDIKYGYCTEFIVKKTNKDVEEFRKELSLFGDSLLAVGGENMIKVHIHTNNPGLVLEKGLAIGELNDIKIDNMRVQHRNLLIENEDQVYENKVSKSNNIKKEPKKYSFITVAMGDGISDVFKDLKVDYVIPGGQTMNPSTEDILKGVEKVDGENIIILPNNGNIVLAAEQAMKISDRNIKVFPTKTIAEGVSALLAFDYEKDLDENLKAMEFAVQNVKTGQVTYAVRDTEINGVKIKKDDIIGICKGEIISNGKNKDDVSLELIREVVEEDSEIITIFYGNDITEDEANELAEKIESELEDCDVEVIYGGQPLYYYIFSIE